MTSIFAAVRGFGRRRDARARVAEVFGELSGAGIVALAGAGCTQQDGFCDCAEVFRARTAAGEQPHGLCFYTEQDAERAKRTGQLAVACWGAPEGAPADVERVAAAVVDAFRRHGFGVDWDGTSGTRPVVELGF